MIDFGDVCAGDPATDLATAWMLFDRADRQRFRSEALRPSDDALWLRAKGWALALALAALCHQDRLPELRTMSLRTVRRALEDDGL